MDRVPGHAGDGQPWASIFWPVQKQAQACSAFQCFWGPLISNTATLRSVPQVIVIIWDSMLLRDDSRLYAYVFLHYAVDVFLMIAICRLPILPKSTGMHLEWPESLLWHRQAIGNREGCKQSIHPGRRAAAACTPPGLRRRPSCEEPPGARPTWAARCLAPGKPPPTGATPGGSAATVWRPRSDSGAWMLQRNEI